MHQDLIRDGYNQLANTYLKDRQAFKSEKYLNQLLSLLSPHSHILDLGCGAGIPVDSYLIKHNHTVTGIDISQTQIQLARRHCPQGKFLVGDIEKLQPHQYQVDAIVSFYAIFHLPRSQHLSFLKTLHSYLPKNGPLLITMGDADWEGYHQLFGVNMWSSHFGPAKNRQFLEQAGFTIILDQLDTSGGERHQILLARRR